MKDVRVLSTLPASTTLPLVDRFGRVHRSLRISVTDACNIRCQYCMPADVRFQPREQHLSFGEITALVKVTAQMGVCNLRITGGEPLLRPRLHELVSMLRDVEGVEELALTTNGMLLAEQMTCLADAGLTRVNISLDTLSESKFKQLTRRDGLDRVLEGIAAAIATPGVQVKLNALVLRDLNLDDVLDIVEFAQQRDVAIRFIEFMPLDGERNWTRDRMVRGDELRQLISRHLGPLTPVPAADASQPATDYRLAGGGRVGFIDSVSQPFCGKCDRLRLTADGKLRNCLFGREEWDVAALLQQGADTQELQRLLAAAVRAKHAAHGIAEPGFQPPQRAMYQIGG